MREPVSTPPRLLPVIDATDPALMTSAPAAPTKSIDASASGVFDNGRFGSVPSATICAIVMTAVTIRIVRDERERQVLARIRGLTCRHADDVVAAERENQQERRR